VTLVRGRQQGVRHRFEVARGDAGRAAPGEKQRKGSAWVAIAIVPVTQAASPAS
jgi:hypothetical protein